MIGKPAFFSCRTNLLLYSIWLTIICDGDIFHRVLLKSARKLAQEYYRTYQEHIPTGQIVQRVANVMQEYTQSG
jgi:hypothetical protein